MEEELCYNCGLPEILAEAMDGSGATPQEGDGGICAECGAWWRLWDGKRVPYTPDDEDKKRLRDYVQTRRLKKIKLTRGAHLN